MKSLIIGKGEIGNALYKVLRKKYEVFIKDTEPLELTDVKTMHICFPFSKNFVKYVKEYQKQYQPKYTIIHSTVPMGTSAECNAYHSPVRGVHPHLSKSLLTFVKYLAPYNLRLKRYFEKAGIKIKLVRKTETTELMKLYCTTIYGLNIIIEKEIYELCKRYGVDFKTVYTNCNRTYNKSYAELGFPQYTKYILQHRKGSIKGHCILPNCELLQQISPSARFILRENKKY
jgi:hypothetical protein